jgi:polysaccharide biosynthesis transport protein
MAAQSFGLGEFSEKHLPSKAWEDDHASNDFDLRAFFGTLRRRKLTMLIAFLAVIGLALLYLVIIPSHYYASASILIDPRLGRGLSVDPSQPNTSSTDASTIDSQVKLLTSQEVLLRVVKSQNLEHDSEFGLKPPGLLARLFGRAKDPSKEDLTPVLKALDEAITIKRPERTYLVEIQVNSVDPVKAANIANAIAHAYIDNQVENRIESATSDLKWVRERMDTLQTQIQAASDKVEAYKSENHIVTTEGLASNEQQVSDLTKELGFARGRESEAKAKLDQIRRAARSNQLDAQSGALNSATIERLRSEQATAERDVARLSNTLGSRHPALLEAEASAAKVKQLIANELQRIQIGAADDYAAAHANEVQLEARIDQLKAQSNTASMNLVPLRQLEREVDALRGSYERFAKIRDNLNEQEAESPPARIVTVARPPLNPSSPRKSIILFLGVGGGLFTAMAAALIHENLAGEGPISDSPPVPAKAAVPRKGFRKRRYLDETSDDLGETRW